jgi:hypothetical protein
MPDSLAFLHLYKTVRSVVSRVKTARLRTLLTIERGTPCRSALQVVKSETPCTSTVLAVVERDTPCTFSLKVEIHPDCLHTVIRFVLVSAILGTFAVLSLNGTLVEAKTCIFTLETTLFIFNKCPIYTRDGASAKFKTS